MLHLVQSEDCFVSPRGIALCADVLGLTTAEVSAVATFYTQYKRRPNGDYTVGVCTNTLCAVMGGDEIYARLSEHLGIGHDETTDDGAITLERVECNAACDYAPVVMVNWEFFDNQTPGSAVDVVDRLRAGEDVAPTRGAAKVCTFTEVSRVLAGFTDGRAGEGVGAGPATLEGLRIARERGWSAPEFPATTAPEPAPRPASARGTSARTASPRTTSAPTTSPRTTAAPAPTEGTTPTRTTAPRTPATRTRPPASATRTPRAAGAKAAAATPPDVGPAADPATPPARTARTARPTTAKAAEPATGPTAGSPAPATAPRARRVPAKATPAPAEPATPAAESSPAPEAPQAATPVARRPAARRPAATKATAAPVTPSP